LETGEDRKLLRPRANADPAWSERLRCELNEAQFKFATADDAVILGLAGPGSGKTRALVYRAAHLIKCGVPPGEILLLTFTNKAAEEMKERLSKLLGSWPEGLWAGTFHSIGRGYCDGMLPWYGGRAIFRSWTKTIAAVFSGSWRPPFPTAWTKKNGAFC